MIGLKKMILALSCAAILFLTVLLLVGLQKPESDVPEPPHSNTLYYSTANKNSSQENNRNSSSPPVSSSQTVYIVREYKGQIGVFAENEETPSQIVDVPVDILPEADQKMLKDGITVRGEDKLNSILEDYES